MTPGSGTSVHVPTIGEGGPSTHLRDAYLAANEMKDRSYDPMFFSTFRHAMNFDRKWRAGLLKSTGIDTFSLDHQNISVGDDLLVSANVIEAGLEHEIVKEVFDGPRICAGQTMRLIIANSPSLGRALYVLRNVISRSPHLDARIVGGRGDVTFRVEPKINLRSLGGIVPLLSLGVVYRSLKMFASDHLGEVKLLLRPGANAKLRKTIGKFGCDSNLAASCYGIRFPRALLRIPNRDHDPTLLLFAMERMSHLSDMSGRRPTSRAVGSLTLRRFHESRPPLAFSEIAAAMDVSVRTASRRLHNEGRTFRTLVANERRKEALRLLENEIFSIQDVASRLGYSDVTSFSRAFRHWFNMAPRAYRRSRVAD